MTDLSNILKKIQELNEASQSARVFEREPTTYTLKKGGLALFKNSSGERRLYANWGDQISYWNFSGANSASDLLTLLKTVDGDGSGLDADLLDGKEETAFLLANGTRALTDHWDAGSYQIRAASIRADDTHVYSSGRIYPDYDSTPDSYIEGVLSTTQRLHYIAEAYHVFKIGTNERLTIGDTGVYSGSGIDLISYGKLAIDGTSVYLDVDVGGNLTLTDTITGTKTLAELAVPAANAAQYVTLALDATLSAERVLTAGSGIGITDGGANSTVTLALSALTGNWDAGDYQIRAASLRADDTHIYGSGRIYPDYDATPDSYIEGVLSTTQRLHYIAEAYHSFRIGSDEKFIISSAMAYTAIGTDLISYGKLGIDGTSTYFDVDISGNLTLTDAITGTKTLADLASPAANSAQYVTLALDATLSAERVLTAGSGIGITDGGANSTVTLALSALTGDWDAGSYQIRAASLRADDTHIYGSGRIYPDYDAAPDSYIEGVLSTTQRLHYIAEAFHSFRIGANEKFVITTNDVYTDTGINLISYGKLAIDGTSVYLDVDVGGNMTFTDTITGTKTLADLASLGSAAPDSAQYVVLDGSGGLTAERVLTMGSGLAMTDGGANAAITLRLGALSGDWDAGDYGITAASLRADTGDVLSSGKVYPDYDTSTGAYLSVDVSNNLVLTDAVTGSKTLAQLSGASAAPDNAQYVVLDGSGGLTAERVLTMGSGLAMTDGGANAAITVRLGSLTGDWDAGDYQIRAASLRADDTHIYGSGRIYPDYDAAPDSYIEGVLSTTQRLHYIAEAFHSFRIGANERFVVGNTSAYTAAGIDLISYGKLAIDGTSVYLDVDVGGNLTLTDTVTGTKTLADLISLGSAAPDSAQYVVLDGSGGLTAERVLTMGSGLSMTDGGANAAVTLKLGTLTADWDGGSTYKITANKFVSTSKEVRFGTSSGEYLYWNAGDSRFELRDGTDLAVSLLCANITGSTIRATSKYEIEDANTYLSEDVSGNLVFTDAVTGSKTLADLLAFAPDSAQYVVLDGSGGLTAERVLTMGSGLAMTDGGANAAITLKLGALSGDWDAGDYGITAASLRADTGDILSSGKIYPDYDTSTGAYLSVDVSNNLVLTDAVTGSKTLAQLSGATFAPDSAQYVVLDGSGGLTAERILTMGSGLAMTDGGANAAVTLRLGTLSADWDGGSTYKITANKFVSTSKEIRFGTSSGEYLYWNASNSRFEMLDGSDLPVAFLCANITGATIRATSKYEIEDANTYLSEDVSGNLVLTDAVTGSKTLAQLSGATFAPDSAQYVVLDGSGGLTAERVLTMGSGLAMTDGGANAAITLRLGALSGDWDAGDYGIRAASIRADDTHVYSSGRIYPDYDSAPDSYIEGVLSTTQRLHYIAEAFHSFRIGANERFVVGNSSAYTGSGIDLISYGKLAIDGTTVYLDVDGSGNLTLTDGVSGTKTLAQLVSGGGAPDSAQYVVLDGSGGLTAERVLTMGSGLSMTDGGANAAVTLKLGTLTADWDGGSTYKITANKFVSTSKEVRFGTSSGEYIYWNSGDGRFEFLDGTDLPVNFKASTFIATDGELSASGNLLFGPDATTGSWRWARSGNNLVAQRYEGTPGAWVTKSTISA
jgi:hypothetical protein